MRKRHSLAALAAGMILLTGAQVAQAVPHDPPVERPASEVGHMGLSVRAWQEYRAGERASASDMSADTAPGHMGLSVRAWQEYRAGERSG